MKKLTEDQAFAAMRLFLERNWERSKEIDVAQILSEISTDTWSDGQTADPAVAAEWHECVELILSGKLEAAE